MHKTANIMFVANQHTATLRSPPPPNPTHSFSFVLTLASTLNYDLALPPPTLAPPTHNQENTINNTKETQQQLPDYIELWSDYLSEAIFQGHAIEHEGIVIIAAPVSEEYLELLHQTQTFILEQHPFATKERAMTQLYSLLGKPQEIFNRDYKRKIAVINFSTSVLNEDRIKPRIHLQGLVTGIFFNQGDKWRSYRILKQDIPSVEELSSYDTVILSGSSHSVNTMPPEILEFEDVLKETMNLNKKMKIMGICFGHQFIAQLNKAKVTTRTLTKGPLTLKFKVEYRPEQTFLEGDMFKDLCHLRIYKYHSDYVTELPSGFDRFGTSDSCEIQGMLSKDHRIFTFQSHPEYTQEYIHWYEQRLAAYTGQKTSTQQLHQDYEHHRTMLQFQEAMRRFLNWSC